ncbi:uncharacterized protein LOC122928083 [Bufo gargarizans]|uniref:uncharacterized protein LOC122928083 n=1 Tax=Bufo gargarizans TaxID=30331 RepID=UPI001CF0DEDA|nr:uncharacterized protein LOC122928083 [Bufo gargarizans]
MQNTGNSTLTVNPQCSYKEDDSHSLPRIKSRYTTLSRASSQTNLTSASADSARSKRTSSRRSGITSLSSASDKATRARAKAEAACAMASYAEQEAELMREQAKSESEALKKKAELEASLHLLKQQKNAAAALAEAEVFTRAAEAQFDGIENQMSSHSAIQRTREYVQSQATMYTDQQSNDAPRSSLTPPAISNFDTTQHCKTKSESQCGKSSGRMLRDQSANPPRVQTDARVLPPQANTSLDYSRKTYNRREQPPKQSRFRQALHQPYQPQPYPEFTREKYSPDATSAIEVAKFLMHREIVGAGLMKFDDRPENYWAWKSSFLSGTQNLNLTEKEKLDQLVRWLGPESTEQAQRIRSVHVHDAAAGLAMVWRRLEQCYGSPEVIEDALLKRIENYPRITNKDYQKLRGLGDLLLEIEAAKSSGYLPGLSYLDTARGVEPIIEKLPYNLQERWVAQASRYKKDHHVAFPPFAFFAEFIEDQAEIRNDPSFAFLNKRTASFPKVEQKPPGLYKERRATVSVRKTEVPPESAANQEDNTRKKVEESDKICPIHNKPHPLRKCRSFRSKTLEERKAYLKDNRICFRCCASIQHLAKDCTKTIQCTECNSDKHLSALHPGPPPWKQEVQATQEDHGGEQGESATPAVSSKCTEICTEQGRSRSCSKICLVKVYPAGFREKAIKMYTVMDEQSNRSLAKTEFFDLFGDKGSPTPYTLKTCSGVVETIGRRANNYIIESLDGKTKVTLPTLIECDEIPDDRSEIPTPEVARHHPHLVRIADQIPALDPDAAITLLLGRDILRLHKVREQYNGPHNAPFAQRLDLGWVIVGEVCLDGLHKPSKVNVYRTHLLQNGRTSCLCPCTNSLHIKERLDNPTHHRSIQRCMEDLASTGNTDELGCKVFERTRDDDKPAPSVEDTLFLEIMDREVYRDKSGSWVAPLPFRSPRHRLPVNKVQAEKRFSLLQRTLQRKPDMKKHFQAFMQKIFDNEHAERAPPLQENQEHWYLPIFGVYHPQKPGQIRVVFDSSAKHEGISLNDVLLSGPDLNNTLLGVLIRFRKELVAVTADVQQMFYCFFVREDHRDYLRFLWYADNDFNKDIIEYRMKVHVFGNSPSPAVAIYNLKRAAQQGERHGQEAKQFVMKNFYVDDGLASFSSNEEAINVLKSTKEMLAESNIRLNKVASNSYRVMEAFPMEDRAKDLKDLDLGTESPPLQRSLGLSWDLKTDSFTFRVSREEKPFTKRGVLSTVNSLYDPLGFVAPIIMQGKAFLRQITTEQEQIDWDVLLPDEKRMQWKVWKDSLLELEQLYISRPYVFVSLSATKWRELCVFSDASTMAIAAVTYLRVIDTEGQSHVGFIMGKSKLAPRPAHTVPRLELCAAVLAVEMADMITTELDIEIHAVNFYTDSKIVLGYIHNASKRFYTYVTNRVTRIRKSTSPDQWHYISTDKNPADHGTRLVSAAVLKQTNWFVGPSFLGKPEIKETTQVETFQLIEPDQDKEVRPQVAVCKTLVTRDSLGAHRFERFSRWKSLTRAIGKLICLARYSSRATNTDQRSNDHLEQAKVAIIKCVQQEVFKEEIQSLLKKEEISRHSSLKKLNPILDEDGVLRIGGRLSAADMTIQERHPFIIPKNHHIALLLVRHYHEQVAHQGRHFTEGAVRSAGLWIIGGKRLVSSVISQCVTCKKIRGKLEVQKMSNLPADRLASDPPFTHVGLDVFGPWNISSRKTRGGSAESKRWAVLFSCLSTRAVHIEVIESLSTSSFINALRRFFSIRGPAKLIRSDRGTNFIGACKELKIISTDSETGSYLQDQGCTWTFNPPHASHMGGAWERMIGVARRILDAMLLKVGSTRLTHEALTTLMAEVVAIMNARPLVPVSTDPEMPSVLTPAMLLTQKMEPVTAPTGDFDLKDLYTKQWRQVQSLADIFWKRWRQEYLVTLQPRKKWQDDKPNLEVGDIVLLKDTQAHRNEWPIGLIVGTDPSGDARVRKVEVRIVRQGIPKVYARPISEVVLLLSKG